MGGLGPGGAYPGQCVGTVPVEGVHFAVEGVDVRPPLDGTGARAVFLLALPETRVTNTVSVGDSNGGLGFTFNTHKHTHTHC